MKSLTFFPIHNALKQIVESIMIADVDFTKTSFENEYIYPWTAKASIFFTLSDEPLLIKQNGEYNRLPLCYTIGPTLTNDIINFGKKRRTVGITFKAGGFQRLMGVPVHLLSGSNDSHQIFGKEIEEIEQRLKEAKNENEILIIIEGFLLKKIYSIRSFSLFDHAIEQSVISNGNIPVSNLASLAGLSIRQFERKCNESLGMSPKLFSRLTRFAKAYTLKENNIKLNWLHIAVESGYFDQMHLIRDFKTFSGYSPNKMNNLEHNNFKIMSILEGKELNNFENYALILSND